MFCFYNAHSSVIQKKNNKVFSAEKKIIYFYNTNIYSVKTI